ncbi:MAG: hypothetical protein DMG24_16335 [Acidobacteria bacterium]|nr:MAG: hypothetical protein DMG24_16335 [Acidobacteriota bacterium]
MAKRPHKAKQKKQGAATDQSGRRKSRHGGRTRFTNFGLLPDGVKVDAENMLVNGATFEDTTEYINQRHQEEGGAQGITLAAVKHYFRSNLDMQRRRVRCMQEAAQTLKDALKGDPDSAQADLANAFITTGLMGLDRQGSAYSVKDAQRAYEARRIADQRIKTEVLKRENMASKLHDLKQAIAKESQGHGLGPETLQKIQAIYGLIGKQEAEAGGE